MLPALAASGGEGRQQGSFFGYRVVTKRRTTGTSPVARDCYGDTRLRTSIAAKWRCTTKDRRNNHWQIVSSRLFDFDSHRLVRWVNLTGRLPGPPHKAPILTHFAASGGEVGEKAKRKRGSSL